MKELEVFIPPVNKTEIRESTEWSNFWIDSASTVGGGRILLIGDSTARMIRSTLAREVGRPVDLLASSSAPFDSLFINQVDCFFKSTTLYHYDCCFVQIGVHGRFNTESDVLFDADAERYKKNILGLCKYLEQITDKVIVETIFLTVKPKKKELKYVSDMGLFKYVRGFINDIPDEEKNRYQKKKNEVIRSLKDTQNVLDICSLMEQYKYKKYDHIHYERDAYRVVARYMIQAISK